MASAHPLLKTDQRRTRVLVADDHHDAAMTLTWAVEAQGHAVLTAFNGLEAVTLARNFAPDVILLDLNMPVMDGLEACRLLRADPRTTGVLLIAQTACGDDDARAQTAAAGFDHHLVKPVDMNEVERLVRSRPAANA